MTFYHKRCALLLAGTLLAASACSGNGTVPSSVPVAANPAAGASVVAPDAVSPGVVSPDDNTSILKKLKNDVVIGSTVDPTNGDMGGHAISVVGVGYVLKKGQVLVCNFEDKNGTAGNGTTIDVFNPTKGSNPTTFVQNSKVKGCDGDAVTTGNDVYGSGMTGGVIDGFYPNGKSIKTYGSPIKEPLADVDVSCPSGVSHCLYSAEYIFESDAETGGIVSFSVNNYGNQHETQVINGFAVNKKPGWGALGPGGLAYSYSSPKDTLFVADGVDNTIVAFKNASELLITDEVTVEKGGKTFKCKFPKTTCGALILSGSPLDAPGAMTLLPNGNLIVANTKGNTLVEIDTSTDKVLATKVVDKSKTAGIFGLAATGTKDSNTALFFTDTNSNNLQELEQ